MKACMPICHPLYIMENYTSGQATAIIGYTPLMPKQVLKSGQSRCRILSGGVQVQMKISFSLDSDAVIFRIVILYPPVRSSPLMQKPGTQYGNTRQKMLSSQRSPFRMAMLHSVPVMDLSIVSERQTENATGKPDSVTQLFPLQL